MFLMSILKNRKSEYSNNSTGAEEMIEGGISKLIQRQCFLYNSPEWEKEKWKKDKNCRTPGEIRKYMRMGRWRYLSRDCLDLFASKNI